NGQVHANVNAKGVIVQGKLEGNINASERTELRKSAIALGDIVTQRVAIEEGAYFKGKVDIQKDSPKGNGQPASPPKTEVRNTPVATVSGTGSIPPAAGNVSVNAQTTKIPETEQKKH